VDLSIEYIKMCGKAQEIQSFVDSDGVGGTWIGGNVLYHLAPMNQSHDRDGYYYVLDEYETIKCSECGEEKDHIKHSVCTWLPRQDQLQDMVMPDPFDSHVPGVGGLARAFGFFCSPTSEKGEWMQPEADYVHQFLSMEQLWLAFVMKEKYNKIWDGKEWISR